MHRQVLRELGFRPKKRLGQHFLIDEAVLERILCATELSPDDIVVEVGPGLGTLTEALARRRVRVVAVEVDSRLVAVLRKRLASYPGVTIIRADILKVTPRQLLDQSLGASEPDREYKVIANLPYYIASPVLWHFLDRELRPREMIVMLQKEVGEAIAAAPGRMSILSVRAQFYSKPAIVCYVPAASFYPKPKVDSVVLRLDVRREPPIKVSDVAGFFEIVMHGFSSPRKQLRNVLSHSLGMPPGQVSELLERAGIDSRCRAETLSLEEWGELCKAFGPFRRGLS